MPDYMKASGIGDSVGAGVGPSTYKPEGFLDEIMKQQKREICNKTAVKQWQKRLHEKDMQKNPEKYPYYNPEEPKPGPGHYVYELSEFNRKN